MLIKSGVDEEVKSLKLGFGKGGDLYIHGVR